MLAEFLTPVDYLKLFDPEQLTPNQWGNHVAFNDGGRFDLEDYEIAILGVNEDRRSGKNEGCANGANEVRKHLYRLCNNEHPMRIIDLGNIEAGASVQDTYVALEQVLGELLKAKLITIIIGGDQDLTIPQYRGYREMNKLINLAVIDERIDLDILDSESIHARSYLLPIFTQEPTYLFNYSQIAYQNYLTDIKAVDILETLNFDCIRLGHVRADIREAEPMIRNADAISFDVSSIRQGDFPAYGYASPNGFAAEEACQIMRYAGISDKSSTMGVYGYNPLLDHNEQGSQLIAQMLWHFVDGVYNRKGDTPEQIKESCMRYTVELPSLGKSLIFWKSYKSDRWWMELPYGTDDRHLRHTLIPCSYSDYNMACREELPDRWMKAYNKLTLPED